MLCSYFRQSAMQPLAREETLSSHVPEYKLEASSSTILTVLGSKRLVMLAAIADVAVTLRERKSFSAISKQCKALLQHSSINCTSFKIWVWRREAFRVGPETPPLLLRPPLEGPLTLLDPEPLPELLPPPLISLVVPIKEAEPNEDPPKDNQSHKSLLSLSRFWIFGRFTVSLPSSSTVTALTRPFKALKFASN